MAELFVTIPYTGTYEEEKEEREEEEEKEEEKRQTMMMMLVRCIVREEIQALE